MRRTKALLSCLLALALVMLTACGARQQTIHRLSADRVPQAATVSQLQEVSDLIVVFTPETQENVLSRYSDGNVSSGYTRTTGRISQVLKGQAPEQLVITEECYTADDALWTQGGYLPMETGKPYLLFLTAYDDGSDYAGMYYPTELERGKYPLGQALTTADSAAQWQVYSLDGDTLSDYQSWYRQVSALYPEPVSYTHLQAAGDQVIGVEHQLRGGGDAAADDIGDEVGVGVAHDAVPEQVGDGDIVRGDVGVHPDAGALVHLQHGHVIVLYPARQAAALQQGGGNAAGHVGARPVDEDPVTRLFQGVRQEIADGGFCLLYTSTMYFKTAGYVLKYR